MTMGICFTANEGIYLAADKRASYFKQDGSFERVVSDNENKIIILGGHSALFLGGLTAITEKIKGELLSIQFNSTDQMEKKITELCSAGYERYGNMAKNLSIGSVIAILATYKNGRPVQIGFMREFNFRPIEYYDQNYLNLKSSNDNLAAVIVQQVNKSMVIGGSMDSFQLLKRTFELVSMYEKSISSTCDIYKITPFGISEMTKGINQGLVEAHLITAGILKGISVQQVSDDGKLLAELYRDAYGGIVKVYDINGFLNAKIGVESGVSDNQAGTMILYNDSPYSSTPGSIPYQRVELGIVSGNGVQNLRDSNGKGRVSFYADSSNPYIGVRNADESLTTYLTSSAGYIDSVQIATIDDILQALNNHIQQYHSQP